MSKTHSIIADSSLIEKLHAQKAISTKAKDEALNILFPQDHLGLWVYRVFLALGLSLTLAGVVFFFAFNWFKITPMQKLFSIEFALISCIVATLLIGAKNPAGKGLLIAASVLVGVFMATFGQIYQTGADAYQLFLGWSVLILGWTIVSNFSAQWMLWIMITNIFLILWFEQTQPRGFESEALLFTIIAAFNGLCLVGKEFLQAKGFQGFSPRWFRVSLTAITITILFCATNGFIHHKWEPSVILAGILGVAGHGLIYYIYRHQIKDPTTVSFIVISSAILCTSLMFKMLMEIGSIKSILGLFIATIISIFIFAKTASFLRHEIKKMRSES